MLGGQLQEALFREANPPWVHPAGFNSFNGLVGSPFFATPKAFPAREWIVAKQGLDADPLHYRGDLSSSDLKGRLTGPVRLVQELASAWSLGNLELVDLLAYPSEGVVSALLDGRITFWPETDRGDRVRIMYRIHSILAELFVKPSDEGRWIRETLAEFDGLSPLEYMRRRRIPGMLTLRVFVEQHLANR